MRAFGTKWHTPPAEVASMLDTSYQRVYQWGEIVPLEAALALEHLTKGELAVDYRLYPTLARARKK